MKKQLLTITIFLLAISAFGQTVTYTKDVASIIYSNCTSCHRSGALAPFALENYQDVYAQRLNIQHAVTNHTMPPWSPDPSYTHFVNEKCLSSEDINKITAWIND